jgi:3alpha(or 20beta)-hydroxysteroid dehydrogenase
VSRGLESCVAIVTGAARGQGAAFARALAAAGACVLLTDVLDEPGHDVAGEIGPRARFAHHDVADPAAWESAIALAEREFGRVTALVSNAGIMVPAPLLETTDDDWERHIAVNQSGAFYGMRAVAPAIARAGGGAIVNICSGASLRGSIGHYAYGASKWALRGMSRAAARELAPLGIRVNAIFPGLVDTEMVKVTGAAYNDAVLRGVPLGRMAAPADVAGAVVFLLSADSAYITGAEFVVDGGLFA